MCHKFSLICKIYKDYALFYIAEHKTLAFAARLVLVCNLFARTAKLATTYRSSARHNLIEFSRCA